MRVLIVYDSNFGNTKLIADTLESAIRDSKAIDCSKLTTRQLESIDLLIVGSPTVGGKPTENLQRTLEELPERILSVAYFAAFDTRFALDKHGLGLKLLMKTIGFAAPKLSKILESKGGTMLMDPEGFIVEGKEGPLQKRELEHAAEWAKNIQAKLRGKCHQGAFSPPLH